MEATNPIFKNFPSGTPSTEHTIAYKESMTLPGVFWKTVMLLILFTCSVIGAWFETANTVRNGDQASKLVLFGVILLSALSGAALVWITVRNNRLAPITAPLYALLQGLVVGVLSSGMDVRYPGIALQAAGLTLAICSCLLIAYHVHLLRVTDSFNRKLSTAITGVIIYYGVAFALELTLGRTALQVLGGFPGILASVIIVIIAAMALISNVDYAVRCTEHRYPALLEWYAAMGILIALIWLYVEVLDLLSKSRKAQP